MTQQDKKLILRDIYNLKSNLLTIRIKKSSGDLSESGKIKKIKKEVARAFTKLNKK